VDPAHFRVDFPVDVVCLHLLVVVTRVTPNVDTLALSAIATLIRASTPASCICFSRLETSSEVLPRSRVVFGRVGSARPWSAASVANSKLNTVMLDCRVPLSDQRTNILPMADLIDSDVIPVQAMVVAGTNQEMSQVR
jgi:hypothetical protein